ncbi:DNA glycosylase superfamily protein [Perilla frutescens var. hirtella]|uniref:DNA glycosylase superfamily protein n=1 Tax=Perilla frutescens var. hirtella TaxID=608512 RepID=A0AAD4JE95_PERFH|nr:DNA glycosylase superfamily protein [Perilla frutescens var. hirtella]
MSGPPRVKSMNFPELESRPVLGPAGNKARSIELRKPVAKTKSEKMQKTMDADEIKGKKSSPEMTAEKIPSPVSIRKNGSTAASILRQRQVNLSMNASCSSDVSSDSSHSRASSGRSSRWSGSPTPSLRRRQQSSSKCEKIENKEGHGRIVESESDGAVVKKRCAWVTSNADPSYAAFHDEEWGLPVHDDKKLFELLSFATALAELAWPIILSKKHTFRDVFLDFDPVAVSKLNEKKIATPGNPANSLLSELKLRAIIENARQICKIIDEVGSFDKYIWGFVNYKTIVGNFRYPRQVPIKTSKADTISKDLVRRGFRGVGPTVVYSFMQVAGITNDHLISCFRHQDCIAHSELRDKNVGITTKNEAKAPPDILELELVSDIDDLSLTG